MNSSIRHSPYKMLISVIRYFKGFCLECLAYVILIFLFLFNAFRRVRLVYLQLERLGHTAIDLSCVVEVDRSLDDSALTIVYFVGKFANKALVRGLTSRNNNVFVLRLPSFFYSFNRACLLFHKVIDNQVERVYSVLNNPSARLVHLREVSYLTLTDSEVVERTGLLETLGIKEPYICVHNRDHLFLESHGRSSNQHHSYRDTKAENLIPAISYFLENGYSVVRMGSLQAQKLSLKNNQYVDYAHSAYRSEKNDLLLSSGASLWFGSSSGANCMALLYNKPVAIFDYNPFEIHALVEFRVFLPVHLQRIFSRRLNRHLSVSEILEKVRNGVLLSTTNSYDADGLRTISNTSEEIRTYARYCLDAIEANNGYTHGQYFSSGDPNDFIAELN